MYINQNLGEIHLKIVYYGPALSGKTTNLEYIHNHTNPQMRSDLVSLKTRGDRTIFFDFLQLELGKISGFTPKFSLYTVPGQAYYAATRKLVLQGADLITYTKGGFGAVREICDLFLQCKEQLHITQGKSE